MISITKERGMHFSIVETRQKSIEGLENFTQ
jgi:hypothetical protein